MAASERMRRVDEAMREVLSDAITTDLKDPRVGFVTVTAVDTSPDLRQARVHISVLGTAKERKLSMKALESAHGFLQRRVAAQLRLKHTPQLTFRYDDTAERADRLERLLSEAEQESTDD
jgi:ribosome-binding factor A